MRYTTSASGCDINAIAPSNTAMMLAMPGIPTNPPRNWPFRRVEGLMGKSTNRLSSKVPSSPLKKIGTIAQASAITAPTRRVPS